MYFNINNSALLTEWQKTRLWEKQANKISAEGVLKLTCQTDRSQLRNKELVVKKFNELLKKCFYQEPPRKATKPSKSAINERIKEKNVRSSVKQNRKKPIDLDD
jgi:ribosome-associated protein